MNGYMMVDEEIPTLPVLGTTEIRVKHLRVVMTWAESQEAVDVGLLEELTIRHNLCSMYLLHQFGKQIHITGEALMASVEVFSLN